MSPELDAGRFAVKRTLGERLTVSADIFKDGHDLVGARVRYRAPNDGEWRNAPLSYDYASDRWSGSFLLDRTGEWRFTVDAWPDAFETWRSELEKKLAAGQDVSSELLEGAELVETAGNKVRFGNTRNALRAIAEQLREGGLDVEERGRVALGTELLALMRSNWTPVSMTTYVRELRVWVDRERATFAAWYELFPRSTAPTAGVHGTFRDAARELDRIAGLGFDTVYLPPIHPVGLTSRKGKNNALHAQSGDPGSPWAIGGPAGGHTAIEPQLGTFEDFEHFMGRARELGIEVALDYALQCSPDHPWLKEHPEWFFVRPDGTLKYAENPPKKYQDIYPLNFWCADRDGLWNACREVVAFWADRGVRTFRVDNPHTKPFAFWEWMIEEIHREFPDVIFLSEAFTRPKRMKFLAKLGFTQSYTYFTWRTGANELREYLEELTQGPAAEYMRGNFFANTPDILHEYLQHGGRAAFRIRLHLAATLLPLYGIYSGYELCENTPLRLGSEEYLDSEKYELKHRDWNAPGNINADIERINRIRQMNPALQLYRNLTFHPSENPQTLFYRKSTPDGSNHLLIAVSLDPHRVQESIVHVPLESLGIGPDEPFGVHDLLTGSQWIWRGPRNYVRLDPSYEVAHVLRVERLPR